MAKEGFDTLRFWASSVVHHLDSVMDNIVLKLEEGPRFPSLTALREGSE